MTNYFDAASSATDWAGFDWSNSPNSLTDIADTFVDDYIDLNQFEDGDLRAAGIAIGVAVVAGVALFAGHYLYRVAKERHAMKKEVSRPTRRTRRT